MKVDITSTTIDMIGRVKVPSGILDQLGLNSKDGLTLITEDGKIFLNKADGEDSEKLRRIDELGRIVVPLELRETLKLEGNEELQIEVLGETLVLSKIA